MYLLKKKKKKIIGKSSANFFLSTFDDFICFELTSLENCMRFCQTADSKIKSIQRPSVMSKVALKIMKYIT